MKTIITALLGVLCAFPYLGNAQNALETPQENRILIKYFHGHQLDNFQNDDPVLFSQLKTYFTASFDVHRINCNDCKMDYNELFNVDLFDVTQFETARDMNTPVSFEYRDKYSITLHPITQVQNQLGGINPEQLIIKTFPDWVSTGNQETDVENYRNMVKRWSILFTDEYRTMTNSPGLLKVRIEDFMAMPQERQEAVLNHPEGYLMIIQ